MRPFLEFSSCVKCNNLFYLAMNFIPLAEIVKDDNKALVNKKHDYIKKMYIVHPPKIYIIQDMILFSSFYV